MLTVAAFIVARTLTASDARRDSEHRAEVAVAQIRDRIEQGVSLTSSLGHFMYDAGDTGVTSSQFASNALRWLSPADLPAAAWAEQVRAADRATYERRIGRGIATPAASHTQAPPASAYLPTTLVSGFTPLDVRGVDLSREPGLPAALRRAVTPGGVAATPVERGRGGPAGLFLVAPAPNLIDGHLRPGAVVVFLPAATLLAATSNPPGMRLVSGGPSSGNAGGAHTVRRNFFVAGRTFTVVMPTAAAEGLGEAVPWIILVAGLVLSVLAAGLAVNAGRRAKAQAETDRIFTLSSDLIAVADFSGHFTRVNPAVEQILGYTQEEFLAKPYLEFVHPDDRDDTAAQAAAIARGARTLSFENRYIHKDGSVRMLDWTSTPALEEGLMYGVARDVTERLQSRAELERLADEQAALRRVATQVAIGAEPGELFAVVTEEVAGLFAEVEQTINPTIIRFDPGPEFMLVGFAKPMYGLEPGSRWGPKDLYVSTRVFRSGQSARVDKEDVDALGGPDAELLRRQGILYQVGSPIVVEGRMWGALTMNSSNPLPPDTGERLASFTELVATAIANADARAEVVRLAQEQAALRRVATLVAQEASHTDVFAAIAEEGRQLLGTDDMGMVRFDADSQLVVASSGAMERAFPVASRLPIEGENAASEVFRTRRAVRIDDYASATGAIAEAARSVDIRSAVGSPIVIEGRLWGAVVAGSSADEPLPPATEKRLAQFSDLVATAIANADARAEVERLVVEQAALRRVAELVAREAPQAQVFARVAEEIANVVPGPADCSIFRNEGDGTATAVAVTGQILTSGVQPGTRLPVDGDGVIATVIREGRPHRVDDTSATSGAIVERARRLGMRSAVGCPVIVRGRVWGALGAGRYESDVFPPDTEERLARFAELVVTAIGNAEARGEVERLAEEQAALRRVAELVAREAPQSEVFARVAEEVASVVGSAECSVFRNEGDRTATVVAVSGRTMPTAIPVGTAVPLEGDGLIVTVIREGRSSRVEDVSATRGAIAEPAQRAGVRSAVACPVLVRGQVWGAVGAERYEPDAFPAETEERLARFAELVSTAIGNAEARGEVERLADEQAALRRVATLVAAEATPAEVFAAVVEEAGRLLGVDRAFMSRFDGDDKVTALAAWDVTGTPPAVELPRQFPTGPLSKLILETLEPVRMEPYPGDPTADVIEGGFKSAVSTPVHVKGRIWGFITVAKMGEEGPPPGTETRLRDFTELVATAVENAEARGAVERLAAEQAALRRVATLVAEGASPRLVFDAVTAEISSVLASDGVLLTRYEEAAEITYVAHRGRDASLVPVGTRLPHEPESVSGRVWRTRAPARMEDYSESHGAMGDVARTLGIRKGVGAPIVVEGRLWGVAIAYWRSDTSPPADTEQRLAKFTELLDVAIANADSHDQLTASRVRLLTEADDARRRVVRDLHDGAQQRLVHSIITLKLARRALHGVDGEAPSLVQEALEQAEQGNAELRELAHGILPSVLMRGGLRAGVDTVVSRLDLPVSVDIADVRLPGEIEASAYFIVAEALTNVVKHAHATRAEVSASVDDRLLRLEVRDDGVGGADPSGHGLVGLADRATALGGWLTVGRADGGGTVVMATLPVLGGEQS